MKRKVLLWRQVGTGIASGECMRPELGTLNAPSWSHDLDSDIDRSQLESERFCEAFYGESAGSVE